MLVFVGQRGLEDCVTAPEKTTLKSSLQDIYLSLTTAHSLAATGKDEKKTDKDGKSTSASFSQHAAFI